MLADNLIFLRNIKGLTQEQIAEVIGISRQSYSKWEQGETYPDIDKCDKLAKYYGVTIDSLVHQLLQFVKSAKQLYLSIKQLQFNKEIMRQSYEIKRKAVIFSRKEETDSRNNRVSGSVS